MPTPFSVFAPASSANLGPGFDALGLALDLWNQVDFDLDVTETTVTYTGSDASLLDDRENLTMTAMSTLAALHRKTLPPFAMTVRADVPVARGLGSSAASIVAGLVAANHILGLNLSSGALFAVAARMEGHGDNVGAAIYGGAILAVPGMQDAVRLNDGPSLGLKVAIFIPEVTGATWVARAELPQLIPHADATFNVGTASGLSVGLLTGDRAVIAAGMHDRLHQPQRARLFPHLLAMMEAAREAGAIGAALSGAGPSVLALAEPDTAEAVCTAFDEQSRLLKVPGRSQVMEMAPRGAYIG